MTPKEETCWYEAGLQCDGVELDDWTKEAIVRYGRMLNGGMNKAGEAILKHTIKNLEALNEQQAQVIHDLRIENSGQAAVIERLQEALKRVAYSDWLPLHRLREEAKEALE
jgi:DNA helicase IV